MSKFKLILLGAVIFCALPIGISQWLKIGSQIHYSQLQTAIEQRIEGRDPSWQMEYLKTLKSKE